MNEELDIPISLTSYRRRASKDYGKNSFHNEEGKINSRAKRNNLTK